MTVHSYFHSFLQENYSTSGWRGCGINSKSDYEGKGQINLFKI